MGIILATSPTTASAFLLASYFCSRSFQWDFLLPLPFCSDSEIACVCVFLRIYLGGVVCDVRPSIFIFFVTTARLLLNEYMQEHN